ncbi:hypothetical protein AB0I84_41655 [Streptomyces spectabilis]|uniref:hypothetical protein n=1 Tax=Streptomyces spectabilis TaxID=68270 RepID=UPI0034108A4F
MSDLREAAASAAVQLTVALSLLAIEAWLLMLVLGALHGVGLPVAAVGYGTALLLMVGYIVATGALVSLVGRLRS